MNRVPRRLRRSVAVALLGVGLSLGSLSVPSAPADARSHPAQGGQQDRERATVGDAASTNRVYLVITALVGLGAGLVAFTVWYWRSTRPEPEALARLEVMSLRRWQRADYAGRIEQLESVRPYEGGDGPLADRSGPLTRAATPDSSLAALVSVAVPDIDSLPDIDPADPRDPADAGMAPMFDLEALAAVGAALAPPQVWSPAEDIADGCESSEEFERLVEHGPHHDDPPPLQQRFPLPGEPLV